MEQKILILECQICAGDINLEKNTELNELIECDDCGSEYEVTSLTPIILTELECVAEDWGQ